MEKQTRRQRVSHRAGLRDRGGSCGGSHQVCSTGEMLAGVGIPAEGGRRETWKSRDDQGREREHLCFLLLSCLGGEEKRGRRKEERKGEGEMVGGKTGEQERRKEKREEAEQERRKIGRKEK